MDSDWLYCQDVALWDEFIASNTNDLEDKHNLLINVEEYKNFFHNNKAVKSIQLDIELCNIVIGDSIIIEYCSRFKMIADVFDKVDDVFPLKNLVTYNIN